MIDLDLAGEPRGYATAATTTRERHRGVDAEARDPDTSLDG